MDQTAIKYVTFIVLHYNCAAETLACVESIRQLERQELVRVVVLDNASVNDSYQELQNAYDKDSQVFLLHSDSNLGFSGGNNRAWDYARQHWDSSFVVLANNDLLFPDRKFIGKVFEEYEKSGFGVLSPDIFHTKRKIHQSPIEDQMVLPVNQVRRTILFNTLALACYPVFYALYGRRMKETEQRSRNLNYRKDIVPMGACLIFSEKVFRVKDNLLAPETFFYYEEYILSYWCCKHQVDIVFQPDIQVLHNHGSSTKSVGNPKEVLRFRMKNILSAAKVYYRLISEKEK